ncbi:hypothetical protein BH11MYX3_BH11MYX3_20330 [soil metagenome]
MKPSLFVFVLAGAAACDSSGTASDPLGPDAGIVTTPDAPVDMTPPEPKPAFTVGSEIGGELAIDETGIRRTFLIAGTEYVSIVSVGLTETATNVHCGVKIAPHFVQFGSASTSTRQFRTVVLDFAAADIVEDSCHWDDAYMLSGIADRFGNYVVGFAQARFAEDRPYVDVYLNAAKGLGNSTANITRAGGGSAYQMDASGTVVETVVEPTPGQPLVRALYEF